MENDNPKDVSEVIADLEKVHEKFQDFYESLKTITLGNLGKENIPLLKRITASSQQFRRDLDLLEDISHQLETPQRERLLNKRDAIVYMYFTVSTQLNLLMNVARRADDLDDEILSALTECFNAFYPSR